MALHVEEISAGLWRWTAPHPGWTPVKGGPDGWERDVACVYYEASEAIVLVDPLVPAAGTEDRERFWVALDNDVARHGGPVEVLLANLYHVRSAREVLDRYRERPGARVRIHESAVERVGFDPVHGFADGDVLPGVRAHAVEGLDLGEVVLEIPAHRALVAADALIGAGQGSLRLAPESWGQDTEEGRARYRSRFRASLRRLLDLPFDRVLVAHGPPVLKNGRRALERALA